MKTTTILNNESVLVNATLKEKEDSKDFFVTQASKQ